MEKAVTGVKSCTRGSNSADSEAPERSPQGDGGLWQVSTPAHVWGLLRSSRPSEGHGMRLLAPGCLLPGRAFAHKVFP